MRNTLCSLILTGLLACAKTPTATATQLLSQKDENLYQIGKETCEQHGKGSHYPTKNIQVDCEEHEGFRVGDLENTNEIAIPYVQTFNWPIPKKLSKESLAKYTQDKTAVFFGENHGTNQYRKFMKALKPLKKQGFTYVALECDYSMQMNIDWYMNDPSNTFKHAILVNPLHNKEHLEHIVNIIDEAQERGLNVICLDNGASDYKKEGRLTRDEYMYQGIKELIEEGQKVVGLFGAAHIRWSSQTEHFYPGHKIGGISAGISIVPFGHMLKEEFGLDQIGLVDLSSCNDPYIPTCFGQQQ